MSSPPNQETITHAPHSAAATALGEIMECLQAGDAPDIEQLLAEHPDCADELRSILPTMVLLNDLAYQPMDAASDLPLPPGEGGVRGGADAARPATGVLGDFRIIREIGRGGMGIVYEAEQISLSRRVALKVLPFAAVLDPRHLQRFKNEALAAAQLAHPNIVDVYGVGCERSIHFYAMRLIEGQTLAAVVEAMRGEERGDREEGSVGNGRSLPAAAGAVPALAQEVARNTPLPSRSFGTRRGEERPGEGLQTAAPITAHTSPLTDTHAVAALSTLRIARPKDFFRRVAELGIQAAEALDHAHQMGIVHRDIKPSNLIIDHFGKLWITDFGLARFQNEPGMTMTGDLLGTLRYMSPEQALAKRIVVDHRTDIYSLGVTLYELLALQPAFDGADREEVIRQIAFEEPTFLRRRKPAIPTELETIIHKAISKNPDDRYATARDLADDLARFSADRPIRAKPPTHRERIVRWSRRNVVVVWSAAAVCLLAAVVLAGATLFILHERELTAAALQTAKANAQLAKDAIDDLYVKFADEWIQYQPGLTRQQKDFLEKAARYYEQLMLDAANDADSVGAVETLHRLAMTHQALGDNRSAINSAQKAVELGESLLSRNAHNGGAQAALAESLSALAFCTYDDVYKKADPEHTNLRKRSAELWEKVCTARPYDISARASLANAWSHLARAHHARREYDDADLWSERAYRAMTDLSDSHPDNIELKRTLAVVLRIYTKIQIETDFGGLTGGGTRTGRREVAQRMQLQSIENARNLLKHSPRSAEYQAILGTALMNAIFYFDRPQAISHLTEAVDIHESLVKQFPDVQGYERTLSMADHQLNIVLRDAAHTSWRLEQKDDATNYARELVNLFRREITRHPDWPSPRIALAWLLVSWPDERVRDADEAIQLFHGALKLERTNEKEKRLAAHILALAHLRKGERSNCIRLIEESIEKYTASSSPVDALDWLSLAIARCQPGSQDIAHKWYQKAAAWLDNPANSTIDPSDGQFEIETLCAEAEELLKISPKRAEILGWGRKGIEMFFNPGATFDDRQRGIEQLTKALKVVPQSIELRYPLALAQYRVGRYGESLANFNEIVRQHRESPRKSAENEPDGTAWDFFYVSMNHARLGNRKDARLWFDRAVAWMTMWDPINKPENRDGRFPSTHFMDQNVPGYSDLRALHKEAISVLEESFGQAAE